MSFLIDTNVLSEIRKGRRCDPNVAAWFASVDDSGVYVSVLVLGEIRRGIEMLRRRDAAQALALQHWLNRASADFSDRLLPIDRAVADEWGRLSAIRTVPVVDGLLVSTARVHGMTFVTRNIADVAGLGAFVLNPFKAG
ncbi:MAG: type II toxin-antitoxin system VapC family toxin [Alphaproteobacteria bacterium]